MYERMLNKQAVPTIDEMEAYCGQTAELFKSLNQWISAAYNTEQKVTFPYGNKYGWCISHKKKQKLLCNIFAEEHAFTVMMRLSDKQYESVYDHVRTYTQDYIDHRYPCGDGGWIHYRVTSREHFEDIQKMLSVKGGEIPG